MYEAAVLAVIAAGTIAMRASFVAVLGDRTIPLPARRMLDHIKPAMYAALIGTGIFAHDLLDAAHLAAVGAAALAAWRGANMIGVIAVGMASLQLARLFV